jgi:hypothetical protein
VAPVQVVDLTSMMHMMRYNDFQVHMTALLSALFTGTLLSVALLFPVLASLRALSHPWVSCLQHDPLSACECTPPYSGENGISARSDLNPANGKYFLLPRMLCTVMCCCSSFSPFMRLLKADCADVSQRLFVPMIGACESISAYRIRCSHFAIL